MSTKIYLTCCHTIDILEELPHARESEYRQIMTEEEARTIMKSQGWTYQERRRRSLGKKYVYTRRRQGTTIVERYICPLSQLSILTEEQLKAKLTPKSY